MSFANINIHQLFNNLNIETLIHACLIIIGGLILARLTSHGVVSLLAKRRLTKNPALLQRVIFYSVFSLFVVMALQDLGFKLNALLGAAGIITIAIGFASQISVSNIISGLILNAEKPFVVGDTIKLDSLSGQVVAIDLLSTRIRTDDNTLVRIPNETLIKSNITNNTYYAMRRFTCNLRIDYRQNLGELKQLLLQLAANNVYALQQPEPNLSINALTDSVMLEFTVWSNKENYSDLKSSLQEQIQDAIQSHQILLGYPQMAFASSLQVNLSEQDKTSPQTNAQKNN